MADSNDGFVVEADLGGGGGDGWFREMGACCVCFSGEHLAKGHIGLAKPIRYYTECSNKILRGSPSDHKDRSRNLKRWRESESPSSRGSESSTSNRGHWKSRTKRCKLADEDDLAEPWTCEDMDPFTHRIRNFKSSRKTRMPNNVKTYDGTGDPEDHLKIFQAAARVERWAMPTWCHMFNFTLIGAARVWFDGLPPESIDGYKGLKAAFLAYFMQQKKYVKDPVEIHNIKQRGGETIEDFIERFKVETGRMKRAPECMRISRFMHGVNNPELTKRLNEHVPKTMEEMMTVTTTFLRGEAAAASKKKGHSSWKSQDQSKRHAPEQKSDFRGQSREGRGSISASRKALALDKRNQARLRSNEEWKEGSLGCDNQDLSRLDNQSIERDRLIGIEFVLNFEKFILFTFGDKEMILVIEAVSR
ncbi:reverse transcriptase domain-containing protein [Tanacetum coccineum]|uniref:Reverse transcriptase domain-containing protein n=1 Tax=Tanacetum coccineum TaxID=301880 RepID=A0ABQ5IM02_9ASTR